MTSFQFIFCWIIVAFLLEKNYFAFLWVILLPLGFWGSLTYLFKIYFKLLFYFTRSIFPNCWFSLLSLLRLGFLIALECYLVSSSWTRVLSHDSPLCSGFRLLFLGCLSFSYQVLLFQGYCAVMIPEISNL